MLTTKDLFQAICIAVEAGNATLEVYHSGFEVEEKSDNSPLTLADKKSHIIINRGLAFSGLPLMSEEGKSIPYHERKNWATYWLVDPLDGTKEFVKRNGEFTINIALICSNKPVSGIIYAPVSDTLYFADEKIGAYKTNNANEMIRMSGSMNDLTGLSLHLPFKQEHLSFTVVASRSHMSGETAEFIDQLKQEHGEINIISKGSSLKLCMVAEGVADVYPRFAPTSEWDTAAGQAIIECSGGRVVQVDGITPVTYNKENILNPWFIAYR